MDHDMISVADKQRKVLVIDDEQEMRLFLRNLLEDAGYEVQTVETGEAALKLAEETSFDVILLDIILPLIDGHEVCRRLTGVSGKSMYIIMLSANNDSGEKVKGFGAGADDFVAKPFDCQELLARVERGWRTVENLRLVKTDFLTGLVNRRGCIEVLTREIAFAKRSGKSLCLAIIDLDSFKLINDTHGHSAGDTILVELAKLMKKHLRTCDYMPARLGGDEFVLVFSGSSLINSMSLLERLCGLVADYSFPLIGPGALTCSIGLTHLNKEDSLESFLNRADKALYCAKDAGRNCVFVS